MKRVVAVVVLLSVSLALSAAAQSVGELFPATNTRYGPAVGIPHLTTNGRDFYLFWATDRKTRATRIDGEARLGNVVFDRSGTFDVAWTGERFLAVSGRPDLGSPTSTVVGRFLDADAQPIAAEFPLAQNGSTPRVAAGAESMLLVYRDGAGAIRSLRLGPDGNSAGAESRVLAPQASTFAVASSDAGFIVVLTVSEGIRAVTLDRQGRTISDQTLSTVPSTYHQVAVASDGTNYLVFWLGNQHAACARIDQNANFDAPLVIDSVQVKDAPAVIWNGVGWSLSYEASTSTGFFARVVHLDRAVQRVISREESAQKVGALSLAALDGRILTAWGPESSRIGGAAVVELPLATHQPRLATYSATQQDILATASSDEGTLIVWSENSDDRRSIRIGVRSIDGRWSERELTTRESAGNVWALAASDGHNFAVVLMDSHGSKFMRIDASGRPFAALPLEVYPTVMAWNGTHYALIAYPSAGGLEGLLLTASGLVTATVPIPHTTFSESTLVSDGKGNLLLVGEAFDCPFELCYSVGLRGTRLGPDLQRLDVNDIVFSDQYVIFAGAVWNGSEYAVVWTDQAGRVAHVPVSPSESIVTTNAFAFYFLSVASMGDGSLAFTGTSNGIDPVTGGLSPVGFLTKDGVWSGSFNFEIFSNLNGLPRVISLPGGGVAYIASSIQDAAPYHGSSHVMMAIAKPSLVPPRPEAPYATTRLADGSILVDWTAPAGALNGFRVEYRIDNGAWTEVDEWFPSGAHHTAIPKPGSGTNYAVRVRAFNDGGASAYSATASTQPGRRRAVR